MRTFLSSATTAFVLSAMVLAAELHAQSAASAIPADGQTLRVFSREVVIDVNVTDAKGAAVHGLTQDEFTVTEDGRPMAVRSFREHRSDQQETAAAPVPEPRNTFTNAGARESAQPLDLILFDSLDTPPATQAIVRKRLADYAGKLAPGTRIAVFALSNTGRLSMVQGFTTNPELVKRAIQSHTLDIGIPPLEDSGQEPNDAPESVPNQSAKTTQLLAATAPKVDQTLECNHMAARGQYTFAALSEIARYVSGMPGRKNLIWFTGLFPTAARDAHGAPCFDYRRDFQVVAERMGHAHVAVYPVDPRALDVLANQGPDSRIANLQKVEHLVMEGVAEDTGGRAFYNTNDLAAAAAQGMDSGSNYYTITYTPANQNSDTRTRNVSIALATPGMTLVYRHHYHAVSPGETVSGQKVQTATALETAMLRGALQPSEVVFHVTAAPAGAADGTASVGNHPDAKSMKPPYRHITLSYAIDASGIEFDQAPDGSYHGQFEYAVNVYDAGSGRILNTNVMAARPALPLPVYQSILSGGMKLRQQVDVPERGDYVLRVGVHDLTSDRVGAVEIPGSAIVAGP